MNKQGFINPGSTLKVYERPFVCVKVQVQAQKLKVHELSGDFREKTLKERVERTWAFPKLSPFWKKCLVDWSCIGREWLLGFREQVLGMPERKPNRG